MPKPTERDLLDRQILELAAERGNDRHAIAGPLGLTYTQLDNRIRNIRDRYHAAVESYTRRVVATREISLGRMEPEIKPRDDGKHRIYELRRGRAGFVIDLDKLRTELVADLKAIPKPKHRHAPPPKGGFLHVVSPADLHIGKLAWKPETGEDFDSRIAEQRLSTAIDKLLGHAARYPVERHLFVVGNDLLQVDNLMSTTTMGTFQDTDSRYRKMFRLAVRLMRETTERLAETAPVSILVVPGNHDQLASFHVGEVLGAMYHGSKRVAVSPELRPRLYYEHGATLLGFCHGNDEKHPDLPLVMAQENKGAWGRTSYREFLVGHLHKKRERAFNAGDSYNGVRVVVLPSLTGTDSWHARKGYIGEDKASESRLYCRTDGLVATFTGRAK